MKVTVNVICEYESYDLKNTKVFTVKKVWTSSFWVEYNSNTEKET